ncbi:hypothetical protein PM082_014905 [Marasmius tenuissimus]|nr:hypothetical protein PM082_014905 [Marasmius tenuissimus]
MAGVDPKSRTGLRSSPFWSSRLVRTFIGVWWSVLLPLYTANHIATTTLSWRDYDGVKWIFWRTCAVKRSRGMSNVSWF